VIKTNFLLVPPTAAEEDILEREVVFLKILLCKIFKKKTSRSIRFFFGGEAAVTTLGFITRKHTFCLKFGVVLNIPEGNLCL
jgi:hypothetical protein